MIKECKICGLKDDEKYFIKGRRRGVSCQSKYLKEWREKNGEYINDYNKENANKIKKLKKRHYDNNTRYYAQKNKCWYNANKEYKLKYNKEWKIKNPDKVKLHNINRKEYGKKYRKENAEKIKEYYHTIKEKRKLYRSSRYKTDAKYKISTLIRGSFKQAFDIYTKNGKIKTIKEYGIDIKAIIEKLGKPPQDGRQYHIDHIFPVSAFDLTNPEHIKLCWHPDNLRWLEASENMSKGNKYNEELFEEYISR